MVDLYGVLTVHGACRTGSGSGWVNKWVVSECEGLGHLLYTTLDFRNTVHVGFPNL